MADELDDSGRSPLLPLRHSTDMFVCDIFDAVPKADAASMEHPIFSLSTKPDKQPRRYEHGQHFIQVTPSVMGLATVHDRDVLIYCISQLIAALNKGRSVSRTVRINAHDFLLATNRRTMASNPRKPDDAKREVTNGERYEGLRAALLRLAGTRIETNIITGKIEKLSGFGLIENYEIVSATRDGRMQTIEITLSDWVFNAIQAKEVLTIHRDYFRLRKPLERRMYELARKHCGHQPEWAISLDLLQKKCGSNSTPKEFRRLVKTIVDQDAAYGHFPDYSVNMSDEQVKFINRRVTGSKAKVVDSGKKAGGREPQISPETFAKARKAAPGYDVQGLYHEWISWWRDGGCMALANPDAAFIGFCKQRHQRAPLN